MTEETDTTTVVIEGVDYDDLDEEERLELVAQVHSTIQECTDSHADRVWVEGADVIRASRVEAALPDDWWAENDGEQCVYAYDGDEQASATVRNKDGDLWYASWSEHSGLSGRVVPRDSVTGARERCVDWVAEKAEERNG